MHTRLCALLSAVILATGFVPRLALCLGTDGHRAVERLDASCCGDAGRASEGLTAAPCARDCMDVPLSVVAAFRASDERGSMVAGQPAAVLPGGVVSPTCLVSRLSRASAGSDTANRCARHLPSTVLLR
jgi:hypothetical protein